MALYALIVDDDRRNLDVLAHLLERQQVQVIRVDTPAALDAALQDIAALDVAFIDLELPGTTGYAVLHHLRADPRFATIPIAAYTVHTSEMDVAYKQGFSSFLSKPIDAQKFPDQLARILRGESVWIRN